MSNEKLRTASNRICLILRLPILNLPETLMWQQAYDMDQHVLSTFDSGAINPKSNGPCLQTVTVSPACKEGSSVMTFCNLQICDLYNGTERVASWHKGIKVGDGKLRAWILLS